jgi:hypothetical protein
MPAWQHAIFFLFVLDFTGHLTMVIGSWQGHCCWTNRVSPLKKILQESRAFYIDTRAMSFYQPRLASSLRRIADRMKLCPLPRLILSPFPLKVILLLQIHNFPIRKRSGGLSAHFSCDWIWVVIHLRQEDKRCQSQEWFNDSMMKWLNDEVTQWWSDSMMNLLEIVENHE